ncbi:hypothetical protein Q9L42_020260 (plasmid) [Methylomarinum sp. Ch1-1]|uniref:Uncharacterized protein n=1 Tax=Methylomarinum roseum TaxID=3067653 RepID=A0AAU7P0C5_9GAMM|nr:hypothetical protein [Methylomarinum sp. Ch1-1]MDP4523248.1 hypothetical protein [Methylomarinum sp. Ch1-1]
MINKPKLFILCIIVVLSQGCATHEHIKVKYTAEKLTNNDLVRKSYKFGAEQEASVGDTVIYIENIYNYDIKNLVKVNTYVANGDLSLFFPNGKINFFNDTPYYSIYKYKNINLIQSKIIPRNIREEWVVYLPVNSAQKIVGDNLFYSRRYRYHSNFYNKIVELEDHPNFEFDVSRGGRVFNFVGKTIRTIDNSDVDIFRQELTYIGKSNNTIKFLYREYYKNKIREAFTHEVSYDLDEDNIIRYKTIRIEVLDSTNETIKYKVISDK